MSTRISGISVLVAAAAMVLAGDGGVLAQEPPARPGGPAREQGPSRTIREIQGLVAELEINAEQQRRQLQSTESSLARARALLGELEGDPEAGRPRQALGQQQGHRSPRFEFTSRLRDQTAAEEMPWRWSDERALAKTSVRELGGGYQARIEPIQENSRIPTITLTREGKDVYSWRGHDYSVFVVARDVLYYPDFSDHGAGCTVLAYDLTEGKLLWRTALWTTPQGNHSQYSNRINLEVDDHHLIVYGNESYGRYLELLDTQSGKIVGYRLIDVAPGLLPAAP
ncbi:hypothetical protein [Paludisphaera rhizosphaerae]|uniref:hypothetical protein n=1 Tax=Paludisphaera rhizosphaerae TaxID=2711216 RepID=UPI0013EE01AE|nr:hypothetical protein [Paludisphaera rhizosphaerae]